MQRASGVPGCLRPSLIFIVKLLSRLHIGPRLTAGFSIVLLLSILVGVLALRHLGTVNDATRDMSENWLASMNALDHYRKGLARIRSAEGAHLSASTMADLKAQEDTADSARADIDAAWKNYERNVGDPEERALANSVHAALGAYLDAVPRTFKASRDGAESAEAARRAYMTDSGKAYTVLVAPSTRRSTTRPPAASPRSSARKAPSPRPARRSSASSCWPWAWARCWPSC